MHLINYLEPIYASLVAGHVFCTSNGMLNWFKNQLPCVMHWDLQQHHTALLTGMAVKLLMHPHMSLWINTSRATCLLSADPLDIISFK